MRPFYQVFLVKNSLGQAAEKSRPAIFENLSAGMKNGGSRINLASEWNQIAFVAAGSVQYQQGSVGTSGQKFVNKIK